MKREFKIGDRVRSINQDDTNTYGEIGTIICTSFTGYGVEFDKTIPSGHDCLFFRTKGKSGENGHCWFLREEDIELVSESNKKRLYILSNYEVFGEPKYKVIFNAPATILFVDGKKYVSKAHDEPFDKEKGLLMCLAKANGISHLDLQRMIKNATVQEKKEDNNAKLVKDIYMTIPAELRETAKISIDKETCTARIEDNIDKKSKRKVGRPRTKIRVGDFVKIKELNDYRYHLLPNVLLLPMVNRVEEVYKENGDIAIRHGDHRYWFTKDEVELAND